MTARRPTALIADDEPLLRDELALMLSQAWPELEVVAQARNGREAVERFEAQQPDICFLDVHMPGVSGVEAARQIGPRAHLVFVTAFDQYALSAFEHGVLDYLVKPVEPARLATTVSRLQARLRDAQPAQATDALLEQLAAHLQRKGTAAPLKWIRATVGQTLRLIAVDEIDFLRSDEKYTLIAWRGDGGKPGEALIRAPLKELLPQLDASQFAQVHRSVVVNLHAISHVTRGLNETADIHLKGRDEVLPVSRTFLHLFRQM
ncbi:LytTR family DNA-binding domain-containing protein [Piscinibacter sp. XHJ-5]|uniref:LytR/AlgR family response regulator transcription factor n=1 Tax=Piscinibacter sp. XHJ-5 TaxID=3037797 RepID=UPI00245369D8|nr:LytTR family DNA-binding domain-containing protein [Piscinibacter sp. XHJ-5]